MTTEDEVRNRKESILQFCRGLFSTTNLIDTDFDDTQLFKVTGRHFPQQPGGRGLHVTFSVSWHAIGKTREEAHDALCALLPSDNEED